MLIYLILIILTSIPIGYLLAYLCRDELVSGRNWFKMISLVSFVLAMILLVFYPRLEIILTLGYIAITSLVSLYLSYNKRFIRKK